MVSRDTIHAVTQSVLSIIILLGGGMMMYANPTQDNTSVVALMSVVITFYFTQSIASRSASQAATQVANAQAQQSGTPYP